MSATATLRILLVEDEPGYARFLREVLLAEETRDHEVTWVGTLEDASARLAAAAFEVVLLDLGLPDADGVEALAAVSAQAPASAIVILSSLGDMELALRSMRLGAQEYLVKGQSEHLLLPRALRHAVERKRLQDEALAARAEAERASAAKDEFLAMLGHELRNPLAPIVTALALIRQREPRGIDRELDILERQVDSVVRLVDDLLDVSRIARGKMELHRADVDLGEVVADAIETTRPLFDRRGHRLEVDVPRERWIVHGDRVRLAQVVANLLSNAAKYTDPGGRVQVGATAAAGGAVALRVRDDGIGMTPQLLERAFELFEHGPQSLDRASGGLGLGLAIVRNLVTLHGGTVTAASEGRGRGSELTVTLPLAEAGAAAEAPAGRSAASVPAPRPLRVLIVDDNQDAAELLELALQNLGYVVQTAHDGLAALEVLERLGPDVALLDIGLPGMDGYELAARIRELHGARAPVLIALTGYGRDSDRERARAAGFHHHLVKPVSLAQLASMVAALPT